MESLAHRLVVDIQDTLTILCLRAGLAAILSLATSAGFFVAARATTRHRFRADPLAESNPRMIDRRV
jgi:hypothetical protein